MGLAATIQRPQASPGLASIKAGADISTFLELGFELAPSRRYVSGMQGWQRPNI
jgi:hypothetical protein